MKVFLRRIHLYLALACGLVFFVQCLTGTALVFEEEITHALHAERYAVAVPAGQPRLSLAQLSAAFRQTHPTDKLLGFKVYADPTRTTELSFKDAKAQEPGRGNPRAGGGRGRSQRGSTAFLNPYTGQLIATIDPRQRPFFSWVENLHRRLVAGEVGEALTGMTAIFILFIASTGLVLWWPSARQALRHHLQVRWSARWKRINYDLHSVVGFYCSLFLFALAFTGVIMAYHWATDGLYWITGTRPTPALAAPVSTAPSVPDAVAYDLALQAGQRTYPAAAFWRVGAPGSPAAAVPVSAPSTLAFRSSGLDTLFADRASGAVLGQHLYARQTAGTQLRRATKPLHTGEIGGIWTKILVCVVTLCSLTFPVTGVIMWLNRTRKQGKRRQRPVVA